MKNTELIAGIFLLTALAGCGKGNSSSADEVVTVDVEANYPEKELVLQDFMEVEYVALETTDEFITHGVVKAVGRDMLLVTNRNNDGNIFVFDRSGKALRRINRLGQSGEEYTRVSELVIDEANGELFVKDYPARKILVYDVYGTFKRSFPFADTAYYMDLFDYDGDHLLCYKGYSPEIEARESGHLLISKQDGSIAREIRLPFQQIETPVVIKGEFTITPAFYQTVPGAKGWALTRASADTVYAYEGDGELKPLIARVPSIASMDPEVFLFLNAFTDRYYFIQLMKKGINFDTMKGYPSTDLIYDKQEKALFAYTLYNRDFSIPMEVSLESKPVNPEIVTYETLDAPGLVEAYEKEQLKGRLKEVAASLDEESNPVIMLIKRKK